MKWNMTSLFSCGTLVKSFCGIRTHAFGPLKQVEYSPTHSLLWQRRVDIALTGEPNKTFRSVGFHRCESWKRVSNPKGFVFQLSTFRWSVPGLFPLYGLGHCGKNVILNHRFVTKTSYSLWLCYIFVSHWLYFNGNLLYRKHLTKIWHISQSFIKVLQMEGIIICYLLNRLVW